MISTTGHLGSDFKKIIKIKVMASRGIDACAVAFQLCITMVPALSVGGIYIFLVDLRVIIKSSIIPAREV